jgi:hypothetical protein
MGDRERRFHRARVAVDAVIQAGDAFFYAETVDLGEMGLSLRTKKSFPVGTEMRLVFGRPPDLPKLDLAGVVRWLRDGDGVGVEFTGLSSEESSTLSTFLSSLRDPSMPMN